MSLTGYEVTFYDRDIPRIIKALEKIADALEKQNELSEEIEKTLHTSIPSDYKMD